MTAGIFPDAIDEAYGRTGWKIHAFKPREALGMSKLRKKSLLTPFTQKSLLTPFTFIIQAKHSSWEAMVPAEAAELIKQRRLLNLGGAVPTSR